jgi:hypothetical protein
MILAVLESHCGVRFGQHDVYLNVAGGYRISEPAADIAVAAALVSSMAGIALPPDCVYFGEISLSPLFVRYACGTEAQGSGETRLPAGRSARRQWRTLERSQLPFDGNFGSARSGGTHRGFGLRKEAINLEIAHWKNLSTFR